MKHEINHGKKWKHEKESGYMRASKYTPYNWLIDLIGIEIDKNIKEFNVIWGANFSVSKKLIHSKPKIFYQNILRYLDYHQNPEEGHFLERVWALIFMNNYNPKYIINSYFIKNIDDFISRIKKIPNTQQKEETHYWIPNFSNQTIYNNFKICLIPPYSSFFEITPHIQMLNNKFSLTLSNYVHLKIIFIEQNTGYEIILGNKPNSVIKLINDNNIIQVNNNNNLKFNKTMLKFDFTFEINENNNFVMKNEDKIIFNIDIDEDILNKIATNNNKSSLKLKFLIKNISDDELLIDYDLPKNSYYENIKLFIINNHYNNESHNFYYHNYLDYFISSKIL